MRFLEKAMPTPSATYLDTSAGQTHMDKQTHSPGANDRINSTCKYSRYRGLVPEAILWHLRWSRPARIEVIRSA
jgi:hypothetical protein